MTTFCIIAGGIAAFVAMRKVTGIRITEHIAFLLSKIFGFLNAHARTTAVNNKRRMDTMSILRQKQSRLFRYYAFINEILLDMGWKQIGVTVEGLTVIVIIITVLMSTVGLIALRNPILVAMTAAIIFVAIIAALFLLSRVGHRRRKKLLIQTEDLLCSSISVGLVQCIKNNMPQISRELQPVFQQFLEQHVDQNMPFEKAIRNLNLNLGEKFDDFCDKSLNYYLSGANKGLQDLFRYNIEENAFITELDMRCEVAFRDMNRDFFACVGLIIAYGALLMAAIPQMAFFYSSNMGRVLLVLYMAIMCGGFIFTQYLQSKNFVFEGKI